MSESRRQGLVSALRRAKDDIEYAICYRDEDKADGFKDLELLLAEINQLGNRANELARQAIPASRTRRAR